MPSHEIAELQRVFRTRLDALGHILDAGEKHFDDLDAVVQERLAPDMFPLGTQVVLACNQPRGFAQWCAGEPVQNLDQQVDSVTVARAHIANTQALVAAIAVGDGKLDEIKRVGQIGRAHV